MGVLLVLGGNPAFTAPADLDFSRALARVSFCAHLSAADDETFALCLWHLPESHELEAWSDATAYDGTAGILQPLISPLYKSRSAHEVLSALLGEDPGTGYDAVRRFWRRTRPGEGFERFWRESLRSGTVADSAFPALSLKPGLDFLGAAPRARPEDEGLELNFRPDPGVWDGRFANNAWLQELPRPLTKLTWDNALLVAPETAARSAGR